MPNFSNSVDVNIEYITGAYCPLPGYENAAEIESESLSEEFNEALTSWTDRNLASGGAVIGKYRPDIRDIRFQSSISGRQKRVTTPAGGAPRTRFKQAGFFDLGISLLVLAVSGTSVFFIEKSQRDCFASLAMTTNHGLSKCHW